MAEPTYESWKIGYPNSSFDSDGLISGINFNFTWGTYVQFDDDDNIYTSEKSLAQESGEKRETSYATFGESLQDIGKEGYVISDTSTYDDDDTPPEWTADPNLDTGVLLDSNLRGISPLKIVAIDIDGQEEEYFVVDWAYGDTSRPSFYAEGVEGRDREAVYYDIEYNGDEEAAIKDLFHHDYEDFAPNHASLISSLVGVTAAAERSISFKKFKRKKLDCTAITMFKEPESGVIADATVATATATAGAAPTTTTTGY